MTFDGGTQSDCRLLSVHPSVTTDDRVVSAAVPLQPPPRLDLSFRPYSI